ncbi:hypothetical protein PPUN110474_37120 [Pseudomonas putida]|nr:hypothetical protein PPUN110474_37120 [Pseudomonas putida]
MLLANGIAEQLTQHMDIFTQTHIDIGHWPSLRRGSGALHPFSAFTRSPVGAGSPAKDPARCLAPAAPVFAGEPAPTGVRGIRPKSAHSQAPMASRVGQSKLK